MKTKTKTKIKTKVKTKTSYFKDRLTEKEAGYVKDIIKGKSRRQAVLNNYNLKNLSGSSAIVDRLSKRPRVIKKILSIAESIPNDLLVRRHLQLLNKKEKLIRNNMTSGEIETIETGEIDTNAVQKGLDMAYKLKGEYAPDKHINLNADVSDEIKDVINKIYG
jgi:hypothetical protein